MDASRCFRGGGLGSGKPLRRFSALWKLLLPQGHYCLSDNLDRHLDRLCRLRLSGHDNCVDICFVRRSVLFYYFCLAEQHARSARSLPRETRMVFESGEGWGVVLVFFLFVFFLLCLSSAAMIDCRYVKL